MQDTITTSMYLSIVNCKDVESGYVRLEDMNTLLVNGISEEAFWKHRKAKYIGVRDVDTWYLMVSRRRLFGDIEKRSTLECGMLIGGI